MGCRLWDSKESDMTEATQQQQQQQQQQQSPSAVILEPPKIKSVTVSIFSPFICHEVMGPDALIFLL